MNCDILVVGGGMAGISAATYTARAGLDTLVVNAGESILNRNAIVENYPGFPEGIDARLLLKNAREGAAAAGARFQGGRVVELTAVPADADTGDPAFGASTGFEATVEPAVDEDGRRVDGCDPTPPAEEPRTVTADRTVAASWSDVSYLDELDVESERRGSKTFLSVDEQGRTTVDGLYAAGRVADRYHQAVVAAGHGATVGITVVHDSGTPFYHDWTAPAGYFTGRDREVPPGCEEIDDAERRRRERRARAALAPAVDDRPEDEPTMHPSVDRK